jgi:hypothetical protein
MGAKSSKLPFPSSSLDNTIKKFDEAHDDRFIESMERADWTGARKPNWHQRFDEFIVNIYDPR